MEIITNLEDAKELAIGEHFIFGEYEEQSIEWIKIAENLAISDKVLDCVIFNKKSNIYEESLLCKWCENILSKKLGVSSSKIKVLSETEVLKYMPTRQCRQRKPTDLAIFHGIYVNKKGYSYYWTCTSSKSLKHARIVFSFGIGDWRIDQRGMGICPALKLD